MDCLKRSDLLFDLMPVMNQLHKISLKLPKFFHQVLDQIMDKLLQPLSLCSTLWFCQTRGKQSSFENLILSTEIIFNCPNLDYILSVRQCDDLSE